MLTLTSQDTQILSKQTSNVSSPRFRNSRSIRKNIAGLKVSGVNSMASMQSEIKEEVDSEEEMNKELQKEISQ